ICCSNCRDTSEPSEIPSSTSTVWVRIGGTLSGRPAIAAMPTAIIAPEISPPGRFAHKNTTPPRAPIPSVSSRFRVLARLGMANAVDAGIWLTPPYDKSLHGGQMRQRDCSNARPGAVFVPLPLCRVNGSAHGAADDRLPRGISHRNCSRRSGSLRLVSRGLLAFGHELLAFLAMKALAIGFLRAFERGRGTRLLFGWRCFCCRRRGVGFGGRRRRLRERRTHQQQGCEGGRGRARR